MSGTDVATIIVALLGTGGVGTGAVGIYRAIRAYARMELLQEQSVKTVNQKNAEISELKDENAKLWTLLEGLTS